MSDLRRRIGVLERAGGDLDAESVDGEPVDLSALAQAVAASIERYSGELSARGYCWRSLAEVIGEAVQE